MPSRPSALASSTMSSFLSADRSSQSRPWLSAKRLALCRICLSRLLKARLTSSGIAVDDDRLLVGVVADLDAEPAQLVGQDRLEVGAELLDPRVGQRPRVQRADRGRPP